MKFAKLFEFEDNQLLVMREFNADDNMYTMTLTTDHPACRISFKLNWGLDKESDANRVFDELDADKAMEWYGRMLAQLPTNEADDKQG